MLTHFCRIQDLDGGFFERFGSLLQQAESKHEEVVLAAAPHQPETQAEHLNDGGDSGVEITADSESEEDEQQKAEKSFDFIEDVVGWNRSV
uniref:CSON002498 protein n=1 Tax=Culicoides sonorensis TaxID=179676 RepID=A0A336MLM5_CULSO